MTKFTKNHSFKIVSLLAVFALCLSFLSAPAVTTFAEDSTENRLVDNANLLTEFETENVTETLNDVSEKTQLDTVIVTTDSTDGKSIESYADDYFDENGYGYGDDKDGVLLCISMADRSWHISTSGRGIDVFSDYYIQCVGEDMSEDLSDGDYSSAFNTFANDVNYYNTVYLNNESDSGTRSSDDSDYSSSTEFTPMEKFMLHLPLTILFSLFIALIGAFFASRAEKAQLTSAVEKNEANQYIVKDSFKLSKKQDIFLFTNTVRTQKETEHSNSDRSRGGGGMHSTHSSSSGHRHGGGGGHF